MRELEVLTSYLSGDTAQVTARVLGIGVESGRTYLQRIMNKFRAAGRDVVTRADLRNRQDLWMGVSGGLLVGC